MLRAGDRVALTRDGVTLKTWTVTYPQRVGVDPRCWTLAAPRRAGSAASLVLRFDDPIDALDRDLIAAVSPLGEAVRGDAVVEPGERVWRFRPYAPWRAGACRIAVSPDLEAASGNAASPPFKTDRRGASSAVAPLRIASIVR